MIKHHARVDGDCENELLQLYGEAAESMIQKLLNRTYDDLEAEGNIPSDVVLAALSLAATWYEHRTNLETVSLSNVPYGFDAMLMPYIILGCNDD